LNDVGHRTTGFDSGAPYRNCENKRKDRNHKIEPKKVSRFNPPVLDRQDRISAILWDRTSQFGQSPRVENAGYRLRKSCRTSNPAQAQMKQRRGRIVQLAHGDLRGKEFGDQSLISSGDRLDSLAVKVLPVPVAIATSISRLRSAADFSMALLAST
jgi:hypothetical protein